MTTPKAHVALSRFLDLTKSAQMTVPKGQNDRTKSGGPYQKRNENAMTVPNVRGSLTNRRAGICFRRLTEVPPSLTEVLQPNLNHSDRAQALQECAFLALRSEHKFLGILL